MPPQIRDINKVVAEQKAALQPQYDLIDSSIAANATSGAAQEAGLKATAEQSYKTIEQNAQDKGMFFSGFSPNEKATYNAGTYLPALAQLQATIAQTRSQLLGKKADLGTKAFDTATQMVENDRAVLNAWNQMTAEQKFSASQADKDRVFQAQQNANKIAADERNSRIDPADKKVADIGAAHGFLQSVAGSDNFVSQTTYAQAKALWVSEGYSPKEFDQAFASYRNPANNAYKLG